MDYSLSDQLNGRGHSDAAGKVRPVHITNTESMQVYPGRVAHQVDPRTFDQPVACGKTVNQSDSPFGHQQGVGTGNGVAEVDVSRQPRQPLKRLYADHMLQYPEGIRGIDPAKGSVDACCYLVLPGRQGIKGKISVGVAEGAVGNRSVS